MSLKLLLILACILAYIPNRVKTCNFERVKAPGFHDRKWVSIIQYKPICDRGIAGPFTQLKIASFNPVGYIVLHKPSATFEPSEIGSHRPYDPSLDSRPLTPCEQQEVLFALNQPYTYYGCGGQSFVFFSADGNYVLKFFKQSRYRPPRYIPFNTAKAQKRKERLQREYGSYKTAFETLSQETGLIYVHFNSTSPTSQPLPTLTLSNHAISLDTTDFVLQRRAILLYDALNRSSLNESKKILTSVINLITTCYTKNCYDKDPKLSDNCGVINGRAVKIDAGRFLFNPIPKRPLKTTLDRHTLPLRAWLTDNHPDLVEHLDLETSQALKSQEDTHQIYTKMTF